MRICLYCLVSDTFSVVVSPGRTVMIGDVGAIAVLANLNRVRAGAKLDHETILVLRAFPSFAVDRHSCIARLHAQRDRSEVRLDCSVSLAAAAVVEVHG